MGLFSMDKSSTTSASFDERLAASEQGIANRGAQQVGGLIGLQTSAEHAVGSNVIGSGARQAQGSNVASEGSVLLQGGSRADFNIKNENVDEGVIAAFANGIKDLLGIQGQEQHDQRTSLQDIVTAQGQHEETLLDKISGDFSKLAESQQTGGDSERNKIVLYVVIAVLVLVGAIFYFRRS